MATLKDWLPVILPAYFGVVSILSAVWPVQAMQGICAFCRWVVRLLGFQGDVQMTDRAVRRCRIFNLLMIPLNAVLLWIALRARGAA